MRRTSLAALLLFVAAPAEAAQWWWVGLNGSAPNRVVTYVDRESVAPVGDDAIEVWALAVGETPLPNGQRHQATRYGIKCRGERLATLGRIGYDSDGSRMDLAEAAPTPFARVVPGSIGESVLRLACGRPTGSELRVAEPIAHAAAFLAGQAASSAAPDAGDDEPAVSLGTGFFVGPAGDLLTSYHVVEGASRIVCRTPDGRTLPATLARGSAATDLALLKVAGRPSAWLALAARGSVHAGDRVFTIGYGAPTYLGVSEPRFTEGTVSALSGPGAEDAYMQISVPIQPGNSGGPLIDEAGRVVGVIAAAAATEAFASIEGALPQSVNWAVKSDYAAPLLPGSAPGPARSRGEAIRTARESLCLIVAERLQGRP